MKHKILWAVLLTLLGLFVPTNAAVNLRGSDAKKGSEALKDILHYISEGWDSLTRSMTTCNEVLDPKERERSVLYLPAQFSVPPEVQTLEKNCEIRVEHLPQKITQLGEIDAAEIDPPGLLYLEHPYVVPGGRFNEMYGWDSYFIIRGLLREGKFDRARGIVENFFFEIEHYGGVLNANRTYYLSRSQPPFLTSMILDLYEAVKSRGQDDRAWLEYAYPFAFKSYESWMRPQHLAGTTGLSRYFDFGEGPVPEMADSPGYYREVARYFLAHPKEADSFLIHVKNADHSTDQMGPTFSFHHHKPEDRRAHGKNGAVHVRLSRDFYKGDRSMRESGFDVSFRFGPFGAATHHFAGVDLNSLLYKEERDLERISKLLNRPQESEQWRERAEKRREAINRCLWDEDRGLYLDYNFETGRRSTYVYASMFYPLWVGLASAGQAAAVERNLKRLEQPGGLAMSETRSGTQWDYPHGWAPVQLLAVEGLRRYGFNADADRISTKFLTTVLENFRRDKTIHEKYDVVSRSSVTHVAEGYKQNVIGFGWTNGVFLELLAALPEPTRGKLKGM
ncbi:MAG: trehalase family glycosidase [Acidobacteriia bacterium]|nr:trehalase family glycosidase [Terriglobia bacterium]